MARLCRTRLAYTGMEPFLGADVSVGVENEFQVAVEGRAAEVDLVQTILASRYYRNLTRRTGRGDLAAQALDELDAFLEGRQSRVWENSWVRFPRRLLGGHASQILAHDLLADKSHPEGPQRGDADRFFLAQGGEPWLRIPISYLLKLALAEAVDRPESQAPLLRRIAARIMTHLISDNSSPEVTSFVVVGGTVETLPGREAARETSRRFFLLQLLVEFANRAFGLRQHGQTCRLYLAPNPPARQKRLNDLISDQFYRELFLNPCLSGWPRGEAKRTYMDLCHRVLSRSQLNTIARLREAGIIVNNLVVLPNTSSTSLANNGTHITLGSRALSRFYLEQAEAGGRACEKRLGDLVIKIVEHFLPLFVATCSAAPHRLAFSDFHPEKVLGYLPHELDSTHLRMLWRRWKKKADLRFCGHSFTPMGPVWLDRLTGRLLGLRGDYLPDVRLLDYLVALHGTEESPALSGIEGNQDRLKRDLTEMGVFDSRMAIYLPYRMRAAADYGFSGFEGRHYSLFTDLGAGFARAVNLQTLVTALAYRCAINGTITHAQIPDDPHTESERRQIFFAAAMGLPTVFVRADTRNHLLRRILAQVEEQRPSRRYRGHVRIQVNAYRRACLTMLVQEAQRAGLAGCFRDELAAMTAMLTGSAPTATDRLTTGILGRLGRGTDPMRVEAAAFNEAAEAYYREELRLAHLADGLETLVEDGRALDASLDAELGSSREQLIGRAPAALFLREAGSRMLAGEAADREILILILLTLVIVEQHWRSTGQAEG